MAQRARLWLESCYTTTYTGDDGDTYSRTLAMTAYGDLDWQCDHRITTGEKITQFIVMRHTEQGDGFFAQRDR